jgi:hypothetical protein
MYHERTKHIDIIYHFLKEVATHGDITVKKLLGQKFNKYVD